MSFAPTYHQHFAFAENTDSVGCCCFFRSKPKEFVVQPDYTLRPTSKARYKERIQANQRLADLIKGKFESDPIDNNEAFERLKKKVNCPFSNGDPLTSEKLAKIVLAIEELKKELQEEAKI